MTDEAKKLWADVLVDVAARDLPPEAVNHALAAETAVQLKRIADALEYEQRGTYDQPVWVAKQ